ncbi:MATE family efflux transporter [Butyrivibrio sp. WCE2006]|uniref:MATE family efflux transporter n=1 Tax=Butyrivibrio sp. WCE2006 TaxID=1410611 RepID=UPI0005D146FB|nr:MATE family efflux transporter [Butyrivibrio sp. WCE2006]
MAKRAQVKENFMGTEKVSKLVISTGIPLMLSLLINSLYNLVDSVFVSRISEDALTALSLAGPVQLIVSSLGLGNAVGLNAVISKALGEKRPDKVKNSEHMMGIGIVAIRILAIAYLLYIPGTVFAAGLQGLSYGTRSMFITMIRQAILPLIFAYTISQFGNISFVWIAFVIAELLGLPVAVLTWKKSLNDATINLPGLEQEMNS